MSDRVKETIRIVHLPTHTPITELKIDPDATVAELQAMVHAHMARDVQADKEEKPLRVVVQRWFREVSVDNSKERVELNSSDSRSTLSSLGITDYTTVFVEGPLTNTLDGIGEGLGIMNIQWREEQRRQERETQETIQSLKDTVSSLVEEVKRLKAASNSAQANFQHQVSNIYSSLHEQTQQIQQLIQNNQMEITIIVQDKIYGGRRYENSNEFTLMVDEDDSIETIKRMISDQTSLWEGNQRLVYNGDVLYDGNTLADYNIEDGAVIFVRDTTQ